MQYSIQEIIKKSNKTLKIDEIVSFDVFNKLKDVVKERNYITLSVDISAWNSSFPEWFKELDSLELLELRNGNIKDIPDIVLKMKNLNHLIIKDNSNPIYLSDDLLKKLNDIELINTSLKEIPWELYNIRSNNCISIHMSINDINKITHRLSSNSRIFVQQQDTRVMTMYLANHLPVHPFNLAKSGKSTRPIIY